MTAPAIDETRIAASDVAAARRWSKRVEHEQRHDHDPASDAEQRAEEPARAGRSQQLQAPPATSHTLRPVDLARRPGRRTGRAPRSSSTSTACSRRSSTGPEDARVPDETRAELRAARRPLRARRVRHRAAERRRARAGRRRRAASTSASTAWSSTRPPRRGPTAIQAFARESAVAELELKPLSAAYHYRRAADQDAARAELEAVAAGGARARLPHALGAVGARGAAAGRRVQRNGRAPPARGARTAAGALRR